MACAIVDMANCAELAAQACTASRELNQRAWLMLALPLIAQALKLLLPKPAAHYHVSCTSGGFHQHPPPNSMLQDTQGLSNCAKSRKLCCRWRSEA